MPDIDPYKLRHPLYLDSTMMVNFLAAIDDGVTYDVSVERRSGQRGTGTGDAEAKIGLPSFLGLLPFDLRGKLSGEFAGERSEELTLVKRHTEASLFNKLRNQLLADGAVRQIDATSDLTQLTEGLFIEIAGQVTRNPLAEILGLFNRLYPMFSNEPSQQATPQGSRRPKQPQSRPKSPTQEDFGMRVLQWVSEDLSAAQTEDVLLKVGRDQPFILTLKRDYGTDARLDDLLGGRLSVLAKVFDVVPAGTEINLLRRSVLGYMTDIDGLLTPMSDMEGLNLNLAEGKVSGPTLQLLPLAIFI